MSDPIPLPNGPQPVQDVYHDEHGVVRFRPNKIVRDMLDFSTPLGFDMNSMAVKDYSNADRVQFAQLIGYSVDGFGDLRSYVTDEDYAVAYGKIETRNAESELQIRNQYLRDKFKQLQTSMRLPMSALYECHPDDVGGLLT